MFVSGSASNLEYGLAQGWIWILPMCLGGRFFSPLFNLCLLSLPPYKAWTLVRRRGTWGHISLHPPLVFPPSALSDSASKM